MKKLTTPNFFIVGAAKSGTSSLWQYLKVNKEVFMPADEFCKEPAFFSPLKKNAEMTLDDYFNIFKEANINHKLIGEASTAYLTDPASAKRIYDFNPEAKIIIILRNPAERAYSLYCWMIQDGYEYASTFKKALALENYRINRKIPNFFEPEYYYNYLYFSSGLYHKQVKRYLDLFKNNVLVIKFDFFKNNLNTTYDQVCSFLDINTNVLSPEVYNVSKYVYSPKLQFILRKINNRMNKISNKHFSISYNSKQSRDWFLKLGLKKQRPPELSIETKKKLIIKYADDIEKLSKLTTISFDDWISEI